jgi:hypothetical protein
MRKRLKMEVWRLQMGLMRSIDKHIHFVFYLSIIYKWFTHYYM